MAKGFVGLALAAGLFIATPALAVSDALIYSNDAQGRSQPVSATNPLPVTGSNAYQATASVPINVSTATTTQLVAISGTKAIYVSHIDWMAGGTDNVTFEYGTGIACGTGTTALTGPYPGLTGSGMSPGDGSAPIMFVPAGNALCVVTSAAVQLSGSVAYAQF